MSICKRCADLADDQADHHRHPKDCGCPCQHKNLGSWKGVKDEEAN